jgi:uncharacterized protein YbaR (Trm112 family)
VFIELLDFLRCPNPHEESWLVLAAQRTDNRSIIQGVLGCPVCQAEFPILGGTVHFHERPTAPRPAGVPDEQQALRLAATLDLTSPSGYVVLLGSLGDHAAILHAITDVELIVVNPSEGIEMGRGLSGLSIGPTWASLPLASASARAIALDDDVTAEQLSSAATAVNAGGRILAPVSLTVPEGVSELARDNRHWVAERTHSPVSSGIISIERRR